MSDIQIVSALDADGNVIGNYAVDPVLRELPGIDYHSLVDFPSEPQPTGEYVDVLENPEDPLSPIISIPVLEWPDSTWSHDPVNGWIKK